MGEKQNILITGAASGIGRASALRMAKSHHVIVADRDGDGAGTVTSEIVAAGGTATAIAVDVSDGASVRAMKAQIETDIGPVLSAFFAAGIFIRGVTGEIPEADWDRMMDIHVKGTFLCCQAAIPDMIAANKGAIVNMSSDFAVMAVPGAAAYMAAKSAIYSLTKSIALEFAPQNKFTDFIEVNINNLAAVPSIIFGLLGLAVFINLFGMPRSRYGVRE